MQKTKDSIGDLKEFWIRSFGFGFGHYLSNPEPKSRITFEEDRKNSGKFHFVQFTMYHSTLQGEFNTICYWGGKHKDCNYSC